MLNSRNIQVRQIQYVISSKVFQEIHLDEFLEQNLHWEIRNLKEKRKQSEFFCEIMKETRFTLYNENSPMGHPLGLWSDSPFKNWKFLINSTTSPDLHLCVHIWTIYSLIIRVAKTNLWVEKQLCWNNYCNITFICIWKNITAKCHSVWLPSIKSHGVLYNTYIGTQLLW